MFTCFRWASGCTPELTAQKKEGCGVDVGVADGGGLGQSATYLYLRDETKHHVLALSQPSKVGTA